jgi:hypothetical protein
MAVYYIARVCNPIPRLEHEKNLLINPLKTKSRLLYLKNQSVYAVSGRSRCLFCDKYKTRKYSVGRPYSCWKLNLLVHHVTSRL